jgi:hypothetical protein
MSVGEPAASPPRRWAIALLSASAIIAVTLSLVHLAPPRGGEKARLKVPAVGDLYFSPTCRCCRGYADYLKSAGFIIRLMPVENPERIKDQLGIPESMRSCHTVIIGSYFVEGHVPVAAIAKMLQEKPRIKGIALPGMPPGAPGMGGTRQGNLVVYAIDGQRTRVFATL